jgi:hypothetical protein
MSDQQARTQILRLLNQPSTSIETTLKRLQKGLQNRSVIDTPYGPWPESTSAVTGPIGDTRNFYKHLSSQISRISTSSAGKRTALRALQSVDAGLSHFYKGLVVADNASALDELQNASGYFKQAHSQLLQAKRELR